MTTSPRLIDHHPNLVDLAIRTKAGVSAYQIGAANTLDLAFAGTTPMFTVRAGDTFRSRNLRQRKLGLMMESNRGLTRAKYDPEEYFVPGGQLPHDTNIAYVRVAEVNMAGVVGPEGPILVVPTAHFFKTGRPGLTLRGTAPAVAPSLDETPPAGSMHVQLPQFASHFTFTNEGGASIYFSTDASMPEMRIAAGEVKALFDGTYDEFYVRGDGAPVAFSVFFAIVDGEMS